MRVFPLRRNIERGRRAALGTIRVQRALPLPTVPAPTPADLCAEAAAYAERLHATGALDDGHARSHDEFLRYAQAQELLDLRAQFEAQRRVDDRLVTEQRARWVRLSAQHDALADQVQQVEADVHAARRALTGEDPTDRLAEPLNEPLLRRVG